MPSSRTSTTIKKISIPTDSENAVVKTVNTRHSVKAGLYLQNTTLKKENSKATLLISKRKAVSPIKGKTLKRCALVNITNAIETQCHINSTKKAAKKPVASTLTKATIATAAKITQSATTKLALPSTIISKPSTLTVKPASSSSKLSLTVKPADSLSKLTRSPKAPADIETKPVVPSLPKARPSIAQKHPAGPILARPSISSVSSRVDRVSVLPPKPSVASLPCVETKRSPTVKKEAPAVVPVSKCKFTAKPKGTNVNIGPHQRRSARRSTLETTDSSLYVSALSDVLDVDESSVLSSPVEKAASEVIPSINIDEEYIQDPYQCATYAYDIFEYLKKREADFPISDYMKCQLSLTEHFRAVLVNWMVDVQENFELNHETLYLGVKLVDTYLSNIKVKKEYLQLVGATAMLIAAKYDERIPPSIEDFLYICEGTYSRKDVMKMEVNILKVANFQLGFPLSYRFLRRYARCAKVQMPLLTLARYILEYTLMDYTTIRLSDSKMAAAALYMAFKMKGEMEWDGTLIHFSGYRVKEFIDVAHTLNNFLHQKPRQSLQTVRNKYSHSIFYEVAKTPLISNEQLS